MANKRRGKFNGRRPTKKRRKTFLRVPRALITPANHFVKLNYTNVITLDPAAAGIVSHHWRANSIFDPDFTGAGFQPPGHDEWAAFYNKYNVMQSNIKVEILPSNSSAGPSALQMLIVVKSQHTATTSSSPLESLSKRSNNRVTYGIFGGSRDAGGNKGVMVIKNSFRQKRDLGHAQRANTEAFMGANPVEDWIFTIEASNPWDASINPGIVNVVVSITYVAKLSERNLLDFS